MKVSARMKHAQPGRAPMATSQTRVLLVDDSDVTLQLIALMIRTEGYEVYQTTDPEDALRLIAEKQIDVLISDWSMPGLDGIELLRLVSRLHPDVVPVMLTAHASLEVALDALNSGHVFRFLTKPMKAKDVRDALRDAAWQSRRRTSAGTEIEIELDDVIEARDAGGAAHQSMSASAQV